VEKGKGKGGGMGRRKKERKKEECLTEKHTGPQVINFLIKKNFYQFIRSGHKICRLGCRLCV
jgi:hypothetical protein